MGEPNMLKPTFIPKFRINELKKNTRKTYKNLSLKEVKMIYLQKVLVLSTTKETWGTKVQCLEIIMQIREKHSAAKLYKLMKLSANSAT